MQYGWPISVSCKRCRVVVGKESKYNVVTETF